MSATTPRGHAPKVESAQSEVQEDALFPTLRDTLTVPPGLKEKLGASSGLALEDVTADMNRMIPNVEWVQLFTEWKEAVLLPGDSLLSELRIIGTENLPLLPGLRIGHGGVLLVARKEGDITTYLLHICIPKRKEQFSAEDKWTVKHFEEIEWDTEAPQPKKTVTKSAKVDATGKFQAERLVMEASVSLKVNGNLFFAMCESTIFGKAQLQLKLQETLPKGTKSQLLRPAPDGCGWLDTEGKPVEVELFADVEMEEQSATIGPDGKRVKIKKVPEGVHGSLEPPQQVVMEVGFAKMQTLRPVRAGDKYVVVHDVEFLVQSATPEEAGGWVHMKWVQMIMGGQFYVPHPEGEEAGPCFQSPDPSYDYVEVVNWVDGQTLRYLVIKENGHEFILVGDELEMGTGFCLCMPTEVPVQVKTEPPPPAKELEGAPTTTSVPTVGGEGKPGAGTGATTTTPNQGATVAPHQSGQATTQGGTATPTIVKPQDGKYLTKVQVVPVKEKGPSPELNEIFLESYQFEHQLPNKTAREVTAPEELEIDAPLKAECEKSLLTMQRHILHLSFRGLHDGKATLGRIFLGAKQDRRQMQRMMSVLASHVVPLPEGVELEVQEQDETVLTTPAPVQETRGGNSIAARIANALNFSLF